MSDKKLTIDLGMLKSLVKDLEEALDKANKIAEQRTDPKAYLSEVYRASGLASGVMMEASLIVADTHALAATVQNPGPKTNSDLMDKLAHALKGGGNPNSN